MRATVTRLRERGKRRHDHTINSDPGVTGDMTLAQVSGVYQLEIYEENNQQMKRLIPTLYEPQVVTMHGSIMLWRGVESVDGAGYVQEWRAVVEPL
jgi:hypothetical protein